jgi:hypothetical protein
MALMEPIRLAAAFPPGVSEPCGPGNGIARHAGISRGDAAMATLKANTNKLLLAGFICVRPSLIIYIPKPTETGPLQSFTLEEAVVLGSRKATTLDLPSTLILL